MEASYLYNLTFGELSAGVIVNTIRTQAGRRAFAGTMGSMFTCKPLTFLGVFQSIMTGLITLILGTPSVIRTVGYCSFTCLLDDDYPVVGSVASPILDIAHNHVDRNASIVAAVYGVASTPCGVMSAYCFYLLLRGSLYDIR